MQHPRRRKVKRAFEIKGKGELARSNSHVEETQKGWLQRD